MRVIRLATIKAAIPINIQPSDGFYLTCVENEEYSSDINRMIRYIKETYHEKVVYIAV